MFVLQDKPPDDRKEPEPPESPVEYKTAFGDTELGQHIGCAIIILAVGIASALIAWAKR
jgi:hypothetical protein